MLYRIDPKTNNKS